MTAQEVAKKVMKTRGITQTDIAKEYGMGGQTSVSMWFASKSMSVDKLLKVLNMCGYDLIVVDRNGKEDGYRITDGNEGNDVVEVKVAGLDRKQASAIQPGTVNSLAPELETLIRRVVRDELGKGTPG